jgi:hypothetical protein
MSVANSVIDLPGVVGHGHCCSNGVAIFACEKDRLTVFPTPHRVVNGLVAEG